MTNIFKDPEKLSRKSLLFDAAVEALEKEGWTVEKERGSGKGSVRRIKRGAASFLVSIRTSQDQWFAFQRTAQDTWLTLADVDYVVVPTVDDLHHPQQIFVHMFEAKEVMEHFDRSYRAKQQLGHATPLNRGIWLSLYEEEATSPVNKVGAGLGLKHAPIAKIPLARDYVDVADDVSDEDEAGVQAVRPAENEPPLTIAEAKRRLALSLGVDIASIKILIEG